ncbi:SoxR reducing system RseC family protein [Iodobacter fluviatilis]|uniref:RseC/MucC-like positive regulator of sigma(E) n=1 Tax=Iodobacter fluviatilis TaxID=537 RepID=A0A377Q7P0_9NEIS|nr:SoxR reducing system RseC family protein [Iodobacter fluviatilis]TCU89563.1 RseC/MucC-like positive regulator of sigma(E) [Iodobacter fluviatilis]STQ90933.1 SoxR reducing system protein RseC [Iodobacter fluviatilis]
MIETEAQVQRLDGAHAWVKIKPHTPCGRCDPETGCKAMALSRMFAQSQDGFKVKNPLSFKAGDWVIVAVEEQMLLKSAVWAYGVPLLLLIAGAAAGQWLVPQSPVSAVLGGVFGFVAGFVLLKQQHQLAASAEPVIVAGKAVAGPPFLSPCQMKRKP